MSNEKNIDEAQSSILKNADIENDVTQLESFIEQNRILEARKELRRLLHAQEGPDQGEGSIGDALAILAREPTKSSFAAIVLVRCLAVQGLLPEPNSINQIIRLTIELCEGAIPDIVSFLKIGKGTQNYEKFAALSRCHQRICEILNPLTLPYGDLDAVLNARKDVIGALNHSIVREYAEPFRIREVRSTVEAIFSKLKKVSALDATLLVDINECNRAIADAKAELAGAASFLNREFLRKYLETCERVLSIYLASFRGRFATAVTRGDSGVELQKRYPLHEPEREIHIAVPLRNSGPGIANSVNVTATSTSDHVVLGNKRIMLGNVPPGDFSVTLDAMIIAPCDAFDGLLSVDWGEIGSPTKNTDVFEFRVVAQSRTIPWQTLEYWAPYSTAPVEGDKFIGRMDKVRQLAAKLLRDPMEPFYITGQKRVGKTSLALAAAQFAKSNRAGLDCDYILWGSIAHVDPLIAVRQLGERIEGFIQRGLPTSVSLEKGNYNGSLANLVKQSEAAFVLAPERRFVIILDEFDEIHQELFLQGNLAETFFANLRALARCKNICIVLVGGENMPFIMDRQGQKLNNFSRINLSYFSRTAEWDDFRLVVRRPTVGTLNWHDDAVSEVFNTTNGNPYFASIVCGGVLRAAISERDADITASEVRRATEAEVSALGANSFAHLWQDGVHKSVNEREPDILRRMRVLVALARCIRKGLPPTIENIASTKTSSSLSDIEIVAVLNDFVRREVLREEDRYYSFALPIFRMWLVDVGVSQLMADALNEELANASLVEENAAIVRSEEVVALSRQWPTYRGRHIGTDEIRAWYQQVESPRDQRILFELLKRTRVFSETHVRERLKSAHALLRRSFPEFVIRKRNDRRNDVLLTYIDGEGKSGASYASLYAEENGISADCVIAPGGFRLRFAEHAQQHGVPAAIIIMDDIAATGKSLSSNLDAFLKEFGDLLGATKVRIVTLVATEGAQKAISRALQKIEGVDVEFRACEILTQENFAFPVDGKVWKTAEDEARAKALCTDLGTRIYKQNPMGFGGLGLLVVFPTSVPNNSLPILHSFSRTGSSRAWIPLFARVVN